MTWILQSSEIKKGTHFTIRVREAKVQESSYVVDEVLENDMYSCEILSDNMIGKINKQYRAKFTGDQIRRYMKENPIYVKAESMPVIEQVKIAS